MKMIEDHFKASNQDSKMNVKSACVQNIKPKGIYSQLILHLSMHYQNYHSLTSDLVKNTIEIDSVSDESEDEEEKKVAIKEPKVITII